MCCYTLKEGRADLDRASVLRHLVGFNVNVNSRELATTVDYDMLARETLEHHDPRCKATTDLMLFSESLLQELSTASLVRIVNLDNHQRSEPQFQYVLSTFSCYRVRVRTVQETDYSSHGNYEKPTMSIRWIGAFANKRPPVCAAVDWHASIITYES